MATSKNLERVCAIVLIVSLLASVGLVYVKANGGESTGQTMGYESRLFDTSRVHTIDIVMDDWDSFNARFTKIYNASCSSNSR